MKYLIVLLIGILVMCCTIKSNSNHNSGFPTGGIGAEFDYQGMHYVVYSVYDGGAAIANITKDSLECEYYKAGIK